jgi:hypothetical protein
MKIYPAIQREEKKLGKNFETFRKGVNMQIKIKSLTGVLYKIDCEETDTTYNLKEKLR